MPTASEVREIASEHGHAKKRNNAIVALLPGGSTQLYPQERKTPQFRAGIRTMQTTTQPSTYRLGMSR